MELTKNKYENPFSFSKPIFFKNSKINFFGKFSNIIKNIIKLIYRLDCYFNNFCVSLNRYTRTFYEYQISKNTYCFPNKHLNNIDNNKLNNKMTFGNCIT